MESFSLYVACRLLFKSFFGVPGRICSKSFSTLPSDHTLLSIELDWIACQFNLAQATILPYYQENDSQALKFCIHSTAKIEVAILVLLFWEIERSFLSSGLAFFYPLSKFIRSIRLQILPQCGICCCCSRLLSPTALHDEKKERLQVLIRQTKGAPIEEVAAFVHRAVAELPWP